MFYFVLSLVEKLKWKLVQSKNENNWSLRFAKKVLQKESKESNVL